VGDEEGVVKFEVPDSCLMAYPMEVGVMVAKGSGSRRTCGRGKFRLYWGVTNSGLGTRTLGTCGGNDDR